MKFDEGEITDLVTETEARRADWARAADIWENAWAMGRYDDDRRVKREVDNIDIVVSPDTFNVIQLLHRFVAEDVRVEIPSLSVQEDDENRSEVIEEGLMAFEAKNNQEQGRNHIHAKIWQTGTLGRGASQVLWVDPALEKMGLKGKRLPISKRSLDPRNVGVGRGAMGVDYAYHKYEASRNYIEQNYPKHKFDEIHDRGLKQNYFDNKHDIVDFWYRHKGSIWHAVLIDKKFAVKPVKTDYPEVPIIEWYADGAPVEDELAKSVGILHPIIELWKMKCDLMSKVATGLMYHYDPLIIARGFEENEFIKTGPGEVAYLNRPEQNIEAFRPEPNVPMAQALLGMIQSGIDQATFPGVSYGEPAGGGQSGYAINSLSQQAKARAGVIRGNIESAMEMENALFLALVEEFLPDEGLVIYGGSMRSDRGKPIKLTKKIIKGNYENRVMLIPEQPMEDAQRLLAYSQLVDKGLISSMFFQDHVINLPLPRDEVTRVRVERALKSPQMQLKADMRAMQETYDPSEWELLFLGTEYEQLYQQEKEWRETKRQEEEQAKAQRAAEKEQKRLQGLLEQGKAHMMPDGTIMEGPPMMPPMDTSMPPMTGLPPSSMPPMPPQGMPPGPMSPMNSMPPGGDSGGMMGPQGMPPAMPGMEAQRQPPSGPMQPPGLQGLPPEMAGQMSPEIVPPGSPPGMFGMMMGGQPPSEEELLNRMMGGGIPPQM